MSGALAVAAATAVLRELLRSGMRAQGLDSLLTGGDVQVSVAAPDRVIRDGANAVPQLNVFLYNAVRNPGWSNTGLPSRDGGGSRVANPPLGLDLYYLLTAYGVQDYEAEVLLGGALQVLHDTPGLSRDFIRQALTPGPNLPPELEGAGLADQVEGLRLSPLPMPSDEISRLWSAFQTPYRASAAVLLSVVLIDAVRASRPSLPVRSVAALATGIDSLRIVRVLAQGAPGDPITASSTIRIQGAGLAGLDQQVRVEGLDATAQVTSRTDGEILLDLGPLAAQLRAGVRGLQVVRPALLGEPPQPHEGFGSNVAAFVLAPQIVPTVGGGGIDVACTPPVGLGQQVWLLLNRSDAPPGTPPAAATYRAPARNGIVAPATQTSSIHFDVPGLGTGKYLVRLQVDGARSPLHFGAGRYDGPLVSWP